MREESAAYGSIAGKALPFASTDRSRSGGASTASAARPRAVGAIKLRSSFGGTCSRASADRSRSVGAHSASAARPRAVGAVSQPSRGHDDGDVFQRRPEVVRGGRGHGRHRSEGAGLLLVTHSAIFIRKKYLYI